MKILDYLYVNKLGKYEFVKNSIRKINEKGRTNPAYYNYI